MKFGYFDDAKKEYVITRRLKAILDGEGASPEA